MTTDGAVDGLWYLWQDLQPIGEYPLASEADALKRLEALRRNHTFRQLTPAAGRRSED